VALIGRPLHLLVLGYVAIVSVVAARRLPSQPGCAWVLVANGLIVGLVWMVTRPGLGRLGKIVAEVYPLLLVVGLYGSLDLLSGHGGGGVRTWDPEVRRWEEMLFGSQVSVTWWQAAPSRFWSTVLHAAYFGYYLIVPAPAVWFAWRGQVPALRRAVFAVTATFVACYLCFIFFPVAGPYYEFPRPASAMLDNWAARLVYGVLAGGSSYGAAFPSSHVAATLAAVGIAATAAPRLALALALPAVLLTVGVVYCQMHYAVDAAAGILVAAAVVPLAARIPTAER
jgi:membrane-associated phospholipid phosphatase